MNSVVVITRFNGNGYTGRIGKLVATCTSGEREAVERVAMKHFGVTNAHPKHFTVKPIKKCLIEAGIGWQPGTWAAEKTEGGKP